jgi:hypothetical protein
VLSALALDKELRAFRDRTRDMDPAAFAREWNAFLEKAQADL